jgi:predicted DNA-binding transcriptional regulator YafY
MKRMEVLKMQESRLFRIVYYLLDKGKSTAPELAEKFEVSVRTIYRDIDTISGMGIPIYATKGKGGGIALLDDFVMDRSLLSNQEKEQILMALQGIMATEQNPTDELLSKLAGLFQFQNTSWIEVDFSNWIKKNHDPNTFNIIKSAIFSHNVISFQYFSNKEHAQRQVEPLRLVFKSKDWYLYGFCRTRNDFRLFKLTRIKKLERQSEIFSRNLPVGYSVVKQMNIETTIPVKLKFDPQMAFRVYDEFADSVIEDEQDNLYVQTYLPNGNALYSYLLSFADSVEVLEPESVRKQMKEKIAAMQEKYIT